MVFGGFSKGVGGFSGFLGVLGGVRLFLKVFGDFEGLGDFLWLSKNINSKVVFTTCRRIEVAKRSIPKAPFGIASFLKGWRRPTER